VALLTYFVITPIEGLNVNMEITMSNLARERRKRSYVGELFINLIAVLRRKIDTDISNVNIRPFNIGVGVVLDITFNEIFPRITSTIELIKVERLVNLRFETFWLILAVRYIWLVSTSDNVRKKHILASTTFTSDTNVSFLEVFNDFINAHN
jgi:hypothetical protein